MNGIKAPSVALLALLLPASVAGAEVVPTLDLSAERPDGRRLLIVALDAVPFDIVESAAQEEALFVGMSRPVPIISSFPSTTTLAFAGMFEALGLETPPGYEARFFDWERGKVRGGGPLSYGKIRFSWRDFFDFKIKGALRKGWGYARPLKFARNEIKKGIASFLASDRPVFFFYISATDGVAHLKGPEELVDVLRQLDRALRTARETEDFVTVLLSDHGVGGGEPLRNVRRSVKRSLKEGGFRLKGEIRTESDAVLVPFGLLSSFVVFVDEGQEVRAVEILGDVDGVSLCAAPEQEGWRLRGTGGSAYLERREGATEMEWRYRVDRGDPLEAERLADRWASDRLWLEKTAEGRFPDAPHRIARAFDLVLNPASVVCSVAPGFMFGSALTEWSGRLTVGRLRWTHGALERLDTLGFLVTDLPEWKSPEVLRFDGALQSLVASRPGGPRSTMSGCPLEPAVVSLRSGETTEPARLALRFLGDCN